MHKTFNISALSGLPPRKCNNVPVVRGVCVHHCDFLKIYGTVKTGGTRKTYSIFILHLAHLRLRPGSGRRAEGQPAPATSNSTLRVEIRRQDADTQKSQHCKKRFLSMFKKGQEEWSFFLFFVF